jgi:hypothetical protein
MGWHVGFPGGLVLVGGEEAVVPRWETLIALVEETAVVAECLETMLVNQKVGLSWFF